MELLRSLHSTHVPPVVSLIVPVFNEQESLPILFDEINQVLLQFLTNNVELILVDDGSTDRSWRIIQNLCFDANWVRGIRLRRNCGKATALSSAFSIAQGEFVITLDGDLQDSPKEIPKIVARLEEGFDLVCGWKKHRKDPISKVLPSRLFNYFINKYTGLKLHDHNCGLKGYRKEAVRNLPLHGDMHRFITLLLHNRGFYVGEVEVEHRPRRFGRSKFGAWRLLTSLADFIAVHCISEYGERPLQFLGGLALALFLLAASFVVILCVWHPKIGNGGTALLLTAVGSGLLGAQSIIIGILAELMVSKQSKRPFCSDHVAEIVGIEKHMASEQCVQ